MNRASATESKASDAVDSPKVAGSNPTPSRKVIRRSPIHRLMATSAPAHEPALADPGWSHYWPKGGPMPLAKLTSKWSHAAGRLHRTGIFDTGVTETRFSL
jgi:hypothetical protein